MEACIEDTLLEAWVRALAVVASWQKSGVVWWGETRAPVMQITCSTRSAEM